MSLNNIVICSIEQMDDKTLTLISDDNQTYVLNKNELSQNLNKLNIGDIVEFFSDKKIIKFLKKETQKRKKEIIDLQDDVFQ